MSPSPAVQELILAVARILVVWRGCSSSSR